MAKIGILTYYLDLNPGVFWQAYATFKAFADLYPEGQVEIIRLVHRGAVVPTHRYNSLAAPIWDVVRWAKFLRCRGMMRFSSSSCGTRSYEGAMKFLQSLNYDLIAVGADTCLELCHVDPDRISPYWLSPALDCHKMLCAASARDTSCERITEKQRELLRVSMSGFRLLGVRDVATVELLRQLAGGEDPSIELVPDPTFHIGVDTSAAATYLQAKGVRLDRKAVLLHLPPSMPAKEEVVKAFRKRGYQVLSFSPLHAADFILCDLSPVEWAGVFRFVEAVVTHRFHDSVFSLKHGTPLLTLVPAPHYVASNGDSKHRSLLRNFGLDSMCLVDDWTILNPHELVAMTENVVSLWDRGKVAACNVILRNKYLGYVRKSTALLNSTK